MISLVNLILLLFYVTLGGLFFARGVCTGTGQFLTGEAYANCSDTSIRLQPPSAAHPFGTDTVGRDILARTIYGGQISLSIGLLAALVSVFIGTPIGLVAGYFGGQFDSILMRFTEAMLNIPQLFLLLLAVNTLGGKLPVVRLFDRTFSGSVVAIIIIIGLTSWMTLSLLVRAGTLSLKEREFVKAAHAIGTSNRRIICSHVIPNTLAPIVVSATMGVADAILGEAYISFLGLGVRSPTASWGNMLDRAYRYIASAPWLWAFPGFLILITVLSVNFVGDGLRDALDPRYSK